MGPGVTLGGRMGGCLVKSVFFRAFRHKRNS